MDLSPAMEKALLTGCAEAGKATVAALEKRGLWADGTFTPDGVRKYKELGGEVQVIHMVRIGTDITIRTKTGSLTFEKGSEMVVVFGGDDRKLGKWWDCYAGKDYPMVKVLRNSAHRFFDVEKPKLPLDKGSET